MTAPSPSALRCPSCGAPVPEGAATCSYCRATLGWGPGAPVPPTRSVRDAAAHWARSIFGAPRNFADLIQSVQVRDEVFERIVTEVARREVREERLPTNDRRSTEPRVDPAGVDPYAISLAALRAASEYVASCWGCRGSGSEACLGCGGSGRMPCRNCGGRGQELRQYQKSSKWVKCSVCRGACTVSCSGCGGSGTVTCRACTGSGHQLAWLTYAEMSRTHVSIAPESPVFLAHRQLSDARPLGAAELTAFGTLLSVDGRKAIAPQEGMDAAFLRGQTLAIDARLERVTYQQYLRLAIMRRDATYEMCGTSSVIVLSGNELVGSHTPKASAPIRLRLYLWLVASVILLVGTVGFLGSLIEPAAYFERANDWLRGLIWATFALATLFIGAALRELRPRFAFGKLRSFERAFGAAALLALCVGGIIALASRPTVEEAQKALAAGDVQRARLVVVALSATKGETPDVRDTEDAVSLAEAKALKGEGKLKILDEVAARRGAHAADARTQARVERRREIQQLLDERKPGDAIADIDLWFPSWSADAEIAGDRARAHDLAYTLCADDACKYAAATGANIDTGTPERAERASASKAALIGDLSFAEIQGEQSLVRLQRLRSLATLGAAANAVAGTDAEVAEKATAATALARKERDKAPLMGADEGIVGELLGPMTDTDAKTAVAQLNGVGVYISFDSQKKCRGVYVAATTLTARNEGMSSDTTSAILSQAVGHSTTVKAATGSNTLRWWEGGTPVVARWHAGTLVEIRIGDATP